MDPSQLECSVCMEDYTAQGDHSPRLLMCGHSFCLSCLRDLPSKGDGLPCPTCRKTTRLGPDGIEGLSANYALIELLSFLKPKGGGAGAAANRGRSPSVGGGEKPEVTERRRSQTVDAGARPRSQTVDNNRGRMPSMQLNVNPNDEDVILVEEEKKERVITPVKKPKESKQEQEKQKELELQRELERQREVEHLRELERQQEQKRKEAEQLANRVPEEEPLAPAADGAAAPVGEPDVEEKHHFDFEKCKCKCKCNCDLVMACRRMTKRDWMVLTLFLFLVIGATTGFAVLGEALFQYLLDQVN